MDEFDLNVIEGTVSTVLFSNIENGYSVLKIGDNVITGYIPEIAPGEKIIAEGVWSEHPNYGSQFKAETVSRFLPDDSDNIFRYLSSGVIKGLGDSTAAQMVNAFGDATLYVLEHQPEKIADIKGISLKKANRFSTLFREKTFFIRMFETLCSYGIKPYIGIRLHRYYGTDALDMIQNNPYLMADENIGGSFSDADRMAINIGFDPESEFRIKAAIVFELRHNLNNGHCFIPKNQLITATSQLINVGTELVEDCLKQSFEDGQLVMENINNIEAVYLPEVHDAECYIASRLIEMKEQVQIITGGPGTGKTTSIRKILQKADDMGLKTYLIAPTGRAAKRMSEVTAKEAFTIHRLLGATSDDGMRLKFSYNEENQLECDLIIVDEASMIDVLLMNALLKAIPVNAKLVIVGDVDQLPPVGPGNVLKALIDSEAFNTTKLTKIFRQAEDSYIVRNAHLIKDGHYPDYSLNKGDFFRLKRIEGGSSVDTIIELCTERLPKKMNISPENIQVISPSKKGELGTINLNEKLQPYMNPKSPEKAEKQYGSKVFRVGDRVMQIRNDYDVLWHNKDYSIVGCGVFNGDVGYISEIDNENEIMVVDFDGKYATYPLANLYELEHAWAMTVHKSQGCEFKAVILALSSYSKLLLRRTVLYTAVTRAKQILIIIGDENVANEMIDNNKRDTRYTYLKYRIKCLCS